MQWRVTEWSDGGTHGLMLPYADPRAYSDRLNDLFTPAGWSRKYTVQAKCPGPADEALPGGENLGNVRPPRETRASPRQLCEIVSRGTGTG